MIDILKALADENRLKVIQLLSSRESLCVCEIEEHLKLPQNLISHHLSILKQAHIVENCRCGKNQYYSLNNQAIRALLKKLAKLGGKQ